MSIRPKKFTESNVSVFQEMWPILRSMGFRLHWKHQNEGLWTRQYLREEPDNRRVIYVQIEEDGRHRATHDIDGGSTIYDREGNPTVLPSEFTDEVGLILAINHEATRMDSQRWDKK